MNDPVCVTASVSRCIRLSLPGTCERDFNENTGGIIRMFFLKEPIHQLPRTGYRGTGLDEPVSP